MKIFKSDGFKIAVIVAVMLGALMLLLGFAMAAMFGMNFRTVMKWGVIVLVGLMML